MAKTNARLMRQVRHRRVRNKIVGSELRPRLGVFRSLNHIYAQIIDDNKGETLVSASTLEGEVKSKVEKMSKTQKAEVVGASLAREALQKGIKQVVFDRGGYKYHGRVKALADAARKEGLEL